MIRHRVSTLLTTASLLLSLTAVSVAVPASTMAAIANVHVGGGIDIGDTSKRAATPPQVSPGNVVGFYLWAKNDDAANLSSFFLTASTNLLFKGALWKHPGDATTTSCGSDINGLKCDFGPLNSMDEILVLAAFTVPTPASISDTNCLPDSRVRGLVGLYQLPVRGNLGLCCRERQEQEPRGCIPLVGLCCHRCDLR